MDSYGAMRGFADSWGLVLLVIAFLAVLLWVFRPGGKRRQDEAASQIFRHEDAPKEEPEPKDKDDADGR